METVNGVTAAADEGEKGGPPPPSPLTGCYLLIIVGEPRTPQHKDIILQRIAKGLLSWDVNDCLVDLEKELAIITEQALEGEEARYGERLIQFASENLVTEILIHPVVSTLAQCMRNLLSSFTRHRHIIHAGYTFAVNGSWALQDGTFSLADFSEAFQELEVQRVIRAYENGISLDIHCSPEGDWFRLPKESFAKACKVRVNPTDVLTTGSPAISEFVGYISPFLVPTSLENLLESSDVVGNIRFSRPTLYVFPGGQGDAALFGINGFNMLLDGGYSRKACFWDFVRHLDRLDAVLMTRLNNSNVGGISSVLRRKKQDAVYPQIGHFFCNIQERKAILSPDGDKDKDPLLINLLDEGQEIISNLRHLNLHPQVCYRDSEPINLYHKVGHGTLDMYVLSPAKDSKEVREFLQRWNQSDQKLFASSKSSREFTFPLQNLISIAALLVWQPANPSDTITRILYPGSSPQGKIFEGLDRLKNLEFIKHPVCTEKSLTPSSIVKKSTKDPLIEKMAQKEKITEKKENKIIENNISVNGDVKESKEKLVKKSDSTESERSTKTKKIDDAKINENEDKPKAKPRAAKPRSESQQRKKPAEKKASPTTPKKTVENGDIKKPLKRSPIGTPAKSAKDANNRKVIESKTKTTKPPAAEPKPKVERKPISRRPKGSMKAPISPVKKLVNGVQKPDTISKKGKLDKEGTTDSSTVSTPSADQESLLKKDISKMTPEEMQQLKAQELADLKEEQEAVKEIEAVFRKGEVLPAEDENLRKVKEVSIEDKIEKEEYLIIEKEEIDHDSLEDKDAKEDEIQKLARDSEESEKQRKLSTEEKVAEKQPDLEEQVNEIVIEAEGIVKTKEMTVEASKDAAVTSPEEKLDLSSTDKKTTDKEIEEVKDVVESQPDEKISVVKSGDTTTAPTLPEDERIPLDEIKEDNGQIIEEKHVKEETKEKDVPVIQLPPKTFEPIGKVPGVVGIKLDKQSHIRDIVKTPDEVADLPVHEEVDYEYTHELKAENRTNEVMEDKKDTKFDEKIQKDSEQAVTSTKEQVKEIEQEKDKDDVVQEELKEIAEEVKKASAMEEELKQATDKTLEKEILQETETSLEKEPLKVSVEIQQKEIKSDEKKDEIAKIEEETTVEVKYDDVLEEAEPKHEEKQEEKRDGTKLEMVKDQVDHKDTVEEKQKTDMAVLNESTEKKETETEILEDKPKEELETKEKPVGPTKEKIDVVKEEIVQKGVPEEKEAAEEKDVDHLDEKEKKPVGKEEIESVEKEKKLDSETILEKAETEVKEKIVEKAPSSKEVEVEAPKDISEEKKDVEDSILKKETADMKKEGIKEALSDKAIEGIKPEEKEIKKVELDIAEGDLNLEKQTIDVVEDKPIKGKEEPEEREKSPVKDREVSEEKVKVEDKIHTDDILEEDISEKAEKESKEKETDVKGREKVSDESKQEVGEKLTEVTSDKDVLKKAEEAKGKVVEEEELVKEEEALQQEVEVTKKTESEPLKEKVEDQEPVEAAVEKKIAKERKDTETEKDEHEGLSEGKEQISETHKPEEKKYVSKEQKIETEKAIEETLGKDVVEKKDTDEVLQKDKSDEEKKEEVKKTDKEVEVKKEVPEEIKIDLKISATEDKADTELIETKSDKHTLEVKLAQEGPLLNGDVQDEDSFDGEEKKDEEKTYKTKSVPGADIKTEKPDKEDKTLPNEADKLKEKSQIEAQTEELKKMPVDSIPSVEEVQTKIIKETKEAVETVNEDKSKLEKIEDKLQHPKEKSPEPILETTQPIKFEKEISEEHEPVKATKEDKAHFEKLEEKLQQLKESVDSKTAPTKPETKKDDESEESDKTSGELFEKVELGRKSPKEREEDVIKIVASVAEVLKSDAPLEEFEGKLPISTYSPYTTSYTTELRETHITTVDSPIVESKTIRTDDIPPIPEEPHAVISTFLDEERKIAPVHEKPEDKRSALLKESQELMMATSKIISDIKSGKPEDKDNADDHTVHRMLVTASSEDGGEETEICPEGTIVYSKSSESSGRSSPEKSQELSKKSSIVDTISDSLSTVRQVRELHSEKDSGIDDVKSDTDLEKSSPTPETEVGREPTKETDKISVTDRGEEQISGKSTPDKDNSVKSLASGKSTPDLSDLERSKEITSSTEDLKKSDVLVKKEIEVKPETKLDSPTPKDEHKDTDDKPKVQPIIEHKQIEKTESVPKETHKHDEQIAKEVKKQEERKDSLIEKIEDAVKDRLEAVSDFTKSLFGKGEKEMEDITTDLQQKVEDIKAESKDVATKAVEQGDKSAEEIKAVEESVIEKIEDIIVDAFESITGAIPSLVEKGEKELEDVTVKSSHAAEDLEKSFVDKVEKKMEETFETIEKKLEHKPENDVPEKEHIEHEVSKTDKDITKLSFVEEKPVTDILEDTSKVNAEHLLDKISESADTMGIEEAKNQLAEISAAVISTVEDIKSTMEEKLTEKAFDEDAKGKEIPVSKAAIAEAAEDIKAKIEETFADKPPKDEQKQSTDDKQTVEETFVPQTVIPVENSKESILEKLDETSKAVVDSVLDGAFEKEIKGRPEDKGKDDVKTETKPSDKNSEAMKEESKKGELSEEVESKKDTEDKEEPTGEKKRRESIVEQLEDGIRGTFSAISDFGKSLFDKGEKVIEDTTASEEHVIEGIKTSAESVIEKVDEEVKSSIASIKHFEESILDSYKCTTNGEKKEVTDKSDDISQKAEIENLKESKIPEFPRDSKSPEMTKLEDLSKTTPIELKETISDQKFHEEIVDKKDPKLVEDLTEKVSPKDEHDTESDKISKTLEEKPSQDKEQDRKESISEIKDTLTEKVLKEKLGTEVKVEPAEEDFKELPKAKLPEAAKIATTDDSVMISKDDSVDLKLDTKIKDGILEEKEERPDLKPEIVAEKTKEVEKSVELVTAKADVKHSEKSDIAEEKDSGIFDSISEIKADLTEKVESEMLEEANEIPDTLKSGEQEKDAIEDIKEIKIKEDSSGGTGTSGKKDTHSDTGEESIELVKEKVKLEIGITDEKSAESQVEPEEGIVSVPLEKSALVITDGTLTTTDVKSPIGKSEEPSEERRSPTKAVEDEKILAKEEAILDKSATDLKKTPDVVPEKIKSEKSSTEEDRDLLKKEEKALEKSAEDIEEEFEIVTDMSKSIVFDKCDTHPQQTSEPGSGKAKSDMTGKTEEVSMHKEDELLKQEERVLEKSEEDIEEAFEAVTDMSKSVVLDKCKSHPQQTSETGSDKVKMDLSGKTEKLKKEDEVLLKKEETALEKSAEDIEEAFEVVTDMSKSVVFDKCEPYSQQTSDTGADKAKSDLPDKTKEESTKKEHEELLKKEEKVLETSAEDIEETFETVTDMSKSVVFDKCETHPHEVSETGADKIKTDLSDKTEKLPTKKEDEELLKKEEQVMAESAEDVEEAFETITDISKSMAFEKCTAHPQQPLENGSDKAKSDLPDKTQKSIEKEHEEVLKKEEKVLEKSAEDIEEAFEIVTDMTKPVIFEKCETHPQQTSETGSDETKSDFTEQSEKSDEMEDKKLLEKEEKVLEKSAEDIKEAFETVTDMSMSVVFDKCTTHPDQTTDVDKTQKSPAEEDKELMKKEGKALGKSVEDLVQASETVADISKSVVLDKNDTHLTEQKSPKNSVEDLTFDKCGISTEVAEIDPKVLKEEQQQLEKSADDLKDTYDRVSKMSTSMSFEKCEKTEDAILHKEEEALEERAKDLTETFETITDMSKSVIFEKCDSVEKRRKSIEDEFVEKTAEDIEEAFETVTDMSKSVIFEKCDKDKEKSDAEKEKFDEKASAELKAEDNIVKDIVDKVTKDVDTKSIEAETKYKSSKGLQEAVGPKIEAKESDIKEVVEKVVAHVDTQSIEAEVKKLPELLVEKQKVEDVKPPIFEKCEKEDMEKTTEPKLESDKTKDLTIDSKDTLPLLEQHHIKDDCKKIDSSLEKQDSKPEKSTLEVSTSEGKKLSVSDVEISLSDSETTRTDTKEEKQKTDSKDAEDPCDKTRESRVPEKISISVAGPSATCEKPEDSDEASKRRELQDTLLHEKHIPGAVTPPTVPVSPSVADSYADDIRLTTRTETLIKDMGLRSSTPGSDDFEIITSTQSDISSGQASKMQLDSEKLDSDEELSVTSQVAYSRDSSHYDLDDDSKVSKIDPMSMSFYGALPDDDDVTQAQGKQAEPTYLYEITKAKYGSGTSLDEAGLKLDQINKNKQKEEASSSVSKDEKEKDPIGAWGKPLGLPAPSTYLYEVTKARYSTQGLRLELEEEVCQERSYLYEVTKAKYDVLLVDDEERDLDLINKNEQGQDVLRTSGYGELPTALEEEDDPIASWGKPLGLPSPAPPNDNKGTPKKERKLPPNVTAKNRLNDDKKRAESPSKYKNKKVNPVYVDLTYVPHHGNSYYAYVDFFKRIRARYYVFSGTEPSREVYNALLEAKQTWEDKELEVTIIPTYDTDILGYWVAENEELLTKYKIDLSPSASRCTINLQDHETSCSAYRLEF